MTDAIVPAAIRLRERPVIDLTGDDVEVTNCVPRSGSFSTTPDGYYFDHNNGLTYFWSASAWQQVSIEEVTGWGILVPDKPQPWITLVRHAYAARMRRQITTANRRLLP